MVTATKKEKKRRPAPDRSQKFMQTLRCVLSPAEVADRADRAAAMIDERDKKDDEMKAAQKHAKSVIESMDTDIRSLSTEVRTRSTYRGVECERQFLYSEQMLREIRLDTGEVVHERRLTDSEMQMELFEDDSETHPESNGH